MQSTDARWWEGIAPGVGAAAAAVAGILAARGRAELAGPLTLAALLLAGSGVVTRRRPAVAVVAAVLAVGFAAGANVAWRAVGSDGHLLPALAQEEREVAVCGTALAERGQALEVSVTRVDVGEGRWSVREPVLAVGEPMTQARAGERLCLAGRLRAPREGFDTPLLVAERAERAGVGSPMRWGAALVRERFREAALGALPHRQAGLLLGMTQGDRELLDEGTLEAFRTTGLAHLVAVSGFHVAVVLGFVLAGARVLVPRGRWLRAAVAVPPLVFFAFLAGLTPSVLRATVTAGIVLGVTATGRVRDSLRIACAAFLLLVFASPDLVYRPAFQMSFGATTGIILWAGRLGERVAEALGRRGEPGRAAKGIGTLLGTATAAQLGVAPFLAAHFGNVPVAGGAANLFAVPLAPVVLGGGLVTLTLASLWEGLGWAPATLRLPLDAILWIATVFSRLPAASVELSLLGALTLTGAAATVFARDPRVRALVAAVALVCGSVAAGQAWAIRPATCPESAVRAMDVGGTAVLLTDGEHVIVADGGPREGGLTAKLRRLGVGKVDVAIASHPHADHTEGLEELVGAIPVGMMLAPPTIGWGTGRGLVDAVNEADVPLIRAETGDVFEVGPRMRLEVLWPDDGPLPAETPGLINRFNLVVRAEVDGVAVLLPGDADGRSQAILAGRPLQATVLVAPHHGSPDLDIDFVDAVDPRSTLVTVDRDNPYGHPADRSLRLYARHGPVFRTDTDGTILVCLEGSELEVHTSG